MDIHSVQVWMKTKSIYDIPLRVTYYTCVSSESDEHLSSLSNQITYYEELIKRNRNWTFVPGYIDEGLSGISTKKRENFNSDLTIFSHCFSRYFAILSHSQSHQTQAQEKSGFPQ